MTDAVTDLGEGDAPSDKAVRFNDINREHQARQLFRTIALIAALVTLAVMLASTVSLVVTANTELRSLALATHPAVLPVAGTASAPATPVVVVSPASFTTSLAGIVSAFVLASTVLAITLVRASFTLKARGDDAERAPVPENASAPDDGVALPGAEFAKAFGEAFQTAFRGVQGLAK